MLLFKPPRSRILAVQRRERAYYFSGAADMVLRKHGVILQQPRSGAGGFAACGLVCRGTRWTEQMGGMPLVVEGPAEASMLQALGVDAARRRTERLELLTPEGRPVGTLLVNRYSVRRIPASAGEISEPYPFVSRDPYWNNAAFDYQSFGSGRPGVPVLVGRTNEGEDQVVGLRLGAKILLGVPLFDLLVQHHACPPYEDAGMFGQVAWSDLGAAEEWLLGAADGLARGAGRVSLRLARWPVPYQSALSIRHDYDRKIADRDLASRLRLYRGMGLKATWFWRLAHADRRQISAVIRKGHEVALHTEVRTGEDFLARELGGLRELGIEPAGYAAHGGLGAAGYLGLVQFLWALEHKLQYGETLGTRCALPHQAVIIEEGVPAACRLVLPAQHKGLDINTRPEGHCYDTLLPEVVESLRRGEYCVLMNHPDIHVDVLERLLKQLALERVWKATLGEVCEWFRGAKAGASCVPGPRGATIYFDEPLALPARLHLGLEAGRVSAVIPEGASSLRIEGASGGAVLRACRNRRSRITGRRARGVEVRTLELSRDDGE